MSLAAVRDLRESRVPATPEELADIETDVLTGFVLARAAAGLADGTIRSDVGHLEQVRGWIGRALWVLGAVALAFDGTNERGWQCCGKAHPILVVPSASRRESGRCVKLRGGPDDRLVMNDVWRSDLRRHIIGSADQP